MEFKISRQVVRLNDKSFTIFIREAEIAKEIELLAKEINTDYEGQEIVFIAILNGAFMFAADLIKQISVSCEITFVKVSSYTGTSSKGRVDELIGLNAELEGKHVIIVEDIVDTGITIDKITTLLKVENPASVKVCSLLFKPTAFQGKKQPDYIGFSIPNKFVVGYGLDYNEKGRKTYEKYTKSKKINYHSLMLNIVLFGPPGAGKGTQSERLIEHYHLIHLSTGDIFRANIKGETELGNLAKSYMDKGQLVPDEVTINMLRSEVMKYDDPKGFIFDGFPRTQNQAIALDNFLTEIGTSITVMLSLEVEEIELRDRLRKRAEVSGRVDDADPNVIQNRINVYNKETAPVKSFYLDQGKLIAIDGIGSIDDITQRLYKALDAQ